MAAVNQFREPSIVDVAGEITSLNAAVPETGREQDGGDGSEPTPILPDELET
jgi:hypothetical protein